MARRDLVEGLAELLGLSTEVIQAYGKPKGRVSLTVALKERTSVLEVKPTYHYNTLKEQAATHPAEEIAPPKTDENDLYAQWRDASDEEKPELEKKLFRALLEHSKGVIWQMMHKRDPELEALAHDITSDAIKNLSRGQFGERAKFSTYVQAIAKNKINEEMERRIIRRERFYSSGENPEDDINLKDPRAEAAFTRAEEGVDVEPLEHLVETLPKKDRVLLDCVLDGMTMAKAADKLGDTEDAAESRWRRLKARLKKKIRGRGDGK